MRVLLLLAILASLVQGATRLESPRLKSRISLEDADLRLTPASVVFSRKGELYASYREKTPAQALSSAIWLRVFDPTSGKELRRARIQTSPTRLPNGADQFILSPDESLVLYAQFHRGVYIGVFNAATLAPVGIITNLPDQIPEHRPRIVGISSDDNSILIASDQFRSDGSHYDVRLLRIGARAPNQVLSNTTVANPFPDANYAVDPEGALWVISAHTAYRYDPGQKKVTRELSIHNQDDVRGMSFLMDRSVLLFSNQDAFGYLYRFQDDSPNPKYSRRFDRCGIEQVLISPDQRYGAAICESRHLGEWRFGSLASRTAYVFGTEKLDVLARLSLNKSILARICLWHGAQRWLLVVPKPSSQLLVYGSMAQ